MARVARATLPGALALLLGLPVVMAVGGCAGPEEAQEEPPAPSIEEWVRVDGTPPEGDPGATGIGSGTGAAADAGGGGGGSLDGDGSPAPGMSRTEDTSTGSSFFGDIDVSGSVTNRVLYRKGEGDTDLDLYSVLSLQVNDPDQDAFSGYFLGRVAYDAAGGTSADNSFFSLNDTWSGSLNARIYEAYVDANQIEGLEKLRIGRQSLWETPEYISFDGLMFETEPDADGTQTGAYAGIPFRAYQSARSDNKVAGAWVEAQPWRGGRVRFDYVYLKDEAQVDDQQNNLLAVEVWQSFDRYLRLRGNYSRVEGKNRDAEFAATYYDPETDLTVQALYKEQLTTQRQLVTEIDPLYETLVQYEPYRHGRLLVSKGLGENWTVEGGAEIRRLDSDADEGTYNREFERYNVTAIADDVVAEDLTVAVTGELWSDTEDGNDYATWGFDLTKEASEELRVSGGMVYAKWKNDFLLDEEREDVRTYYTRLRYQATEQTIWSLGYDFEDNDLDNFHTLTARMTWRF